MTSSKDNNLGFPPEIIRFVGKKWVVPIFKEFETHEKIKFGELKKTFSITSKVLSDILKEMKQFGFIIKHSERMFPPSVPYTLSNRGHNLLDVIDRLEEFSKGIEIIQNKKTKGDEKFVSKFAILLAIEKSLIKMGPLELKKVESKLLEEFNCTLEDCTLNPTPLEKVLCYLFGHCYDEIYQSMDFTLEDTKMDEDISNFLRVMHV